MKADELFVLLLVVVSIGTVAAIAIRSRQHDNHPDARGAHLHDEIVNDDGRPRETEIVSSAATDERRAEHQRASKNAKTSPMP
jgi:hypothetical protein